MFLHLGNKVIISRYDIVAILDYDSMMISKINKEYMNNAKQNKLIEKTDKEGKKKTIIITSDKKIYLSSISSSTLKKRFTTMDY